LEERCSDEHQQKVLKEMAEVWSKLAEETDKKDR
jgi:hypothetical protein